MIACLLNKFWRGADLVEAFRFDVRVLLVLVEGVTSLLEVVLHQVDVVLIVLHVDARVLDQNDAELVEALCHFLAFNADLIG